MDRFWPLAQYIRRCEAWERNGVLSVFVGDAESIQRIWLPNRARSHHDRLNSGRLQNARVRSQSNPYLLLLPLMFEQHISSDILLNHELNKIPSGNLYLRQTHTVIQLVEVASPPPRRISSVINSSSAASSSYTSSTSSSFDQEDQQQGEEDSICSSYCSSDVPLDEMDVPLSPRTASHPDTFSGKMKRILLWREQSPHLITDSTSPKRKLQEIEEDIIDNDDNVSHSSKRSRSSASSSSLSSDRSIISLGMHSCPACDAFFPTRQNLRQHGRDAQSNEACSVAVEYAFE